MDLKRLRDQVLEELGKPAARRTAQHSADQVGVAAAVNRLFARSAQVANDRASTVVLRCRRREFRLPRHGAAAVPLARRSAPTLPWHSDYRPAAGVRSKFGALMSCRVLSMSAFVPISITRVLGPDPLAYSTTPHRAVGHDNGPSVKIIRRI